MQSSTDISLSTVYDHEREMERRQRDSEYNRAHGNPQPPQPPSRPPAANNNSATPSGPPPKTHIRNDGNDLDFDTSTYNTMTTQEITTFLNSTCSMLDSMLGSRHHDLPLSTVEFYKPKTPAPPYDPKKDAIEPCYAIETALFGSVATLKTLYEAGTLLFKPIPKLENKFPDDPSKVGHIFREDSGHVVDTPDMRNKILQVCNDRKNCIGFDPYDNLWFAKTFPENSTQIWVRTRGGLITNAGLNKNVLDYDPEFLNIKIQYGMKP